MVNEEILKEILSLLARGNYSDPKFLKYLKMSEEDFIGLAVLAYKYERLNSDYPVSKMGFIRKYVLSAESVIKAFGFTPIRHAIEDKLIIAMGRVAAEKEETDHG